MGLPLYIDGEKKIYIFIGYSNIKEGFGSMSYDREMKLIRYEEGKTKYTDKDIIKILLKGITKLPEIVVDEYYDIDTTKISYSKNEKILVDTVIYDIVPAKAKEELPHYI